MTKNISLKGPVYHRAGHVLLNSKTLIENGYVCVEGGKIKEVGKWPSAKTGGCIKDHGYGTLMPAFVNTHTHLELGALKGQMTYSEGFGVWVKQLLEKRSSLTEENLIEGVNSGIKELTNTGTAVAGEISTLGISEIPFCNSSLKGVFFREYIGNQTPEFAHDTGHNLYKKISMAGHAPHTTSPLLLKKLKKMTNSKNLPFSIHLAESEDENTFITTGKGAWADFLKERGIDYSDWNLPASGSVTYCDLLGILNESTIGVHILSASADELNILAEKKVNVCICPRSNINLHDKLPSVYEMFEHNVRLCLGTDSHASTETLSMLDEMTFLAKYFQDIAPVKIFEMASVNGAEALGLAKYYGTLEPGKKADIIYSPIVKKRINDFFNILLNNGSDYGCRFVAGLNERNEE